MLSSNNPTSLALPILLRWMPSLPYCAAFELIVDVYKHRVLVLLHTSITWVFIPIFLLTVKELTSSRGMIFAKLTDQGLVLYNISSELLYLMLLTHNKVGKQVMFWMFEIRVSGCGPLCGYHMNLFCKCGWGCRYRVVINCRWGCGHECQVMISGLMRLLMWIFFIYTAVINTNYYQMPTTFIITYCI